MVQESNVDVYEVQPHELVCGLIEVIRETEKQIGYYEMKKMTKEHLDKNSKPIFEKKAKNLTTAEITALASKLYTKLMMKGTIQALSALSKYHAEAKGMSKQQLLSDRHKPKRLSKHMEATGIPKPLNVAAHAIVSGRHPEAKAARRILAKFKIRIDDPDNGVYLPRDSRFLPHEDMPNAPSHAKIHTKEYYLNVTNILSGTTSPLECRVALKLIAKKLQNGTLEY
ncbi:AHH domain-containing protein [Marinibactrum halimedae]|uniref:Uncharacterized protein n=1 Tax=Marinibactrum halimedae TaxID=1444977 RepID=A0AA37WNI6_9GAMM|nr:AHH domain-containing protein [Marinibactrum halimedae]MCD9457977.1 AHH domain-containing protein [Marinibactrum halimedae]GLS27603.1 hypothetical protein GCM10007877_33220 [Marinibactrum halimedae]